MSIMTYSPGTDLCELSLKLLWTADWPYCMECGGPLMMPHHERAEVKQAGKCFLEGNVTFTDVKYVCMGTDFVCNFCAEHHTISWYAFYSPDGDRYQLADFFWAVIKAPRIKREKINYETYSLLRGMRLR